MLRAGIARPAWLAHGIARSASPVHSISRAAWLVHGTTRSARLLLGLAHSRHYSPSVACSRHCPPQVPFTIFLVQHRSFTAACSRRLVLGGSFPATRSRRLALTALLGGSLPVARFLLPHPLPQLPLGHLTPGVFLLSRHPPPHIRRGEEV